MFVNEKKINSLFLKWLNTSLILVFLIIIIGGLTRLTNSGLSITEWELFKGILFPLNEGTWNYYFEQYKKIPQYKLINSNMSLDEFKIIFYWEYAHRLIARLIGLFFLIPLIFFYISKKIDKIYLKKCNLIFLLIVFQGVIGWFMVKSGLVNDVTVSHYRLSVHLTTAIFIISSIFWLTRNIDYKNNIKFFNFSIKYLPFQFLIVIIYTQIIMGAFVSGLDAGKIYQTWPLMGNSYVPNDLEIENYQSLLEFNNHSLVQFYHRNLAYFLVFYIILLTLYIFKKKLSNLYKPLKIVIIVLFLQALLGIFTLVSNLNIYLASIHQITSVLLVFSALNLYYYRAK
tara:strand:+ start:753 stop:1778 length:1026 start_codon:yes stop_codon:yes gene_type:complete